MKKRKKKSLYRKAITYLISGALLTLGSGAYILYDALHPRTVETVILYDDSPKTLIDLDYRFDYSNSEVLFLSNENIEENTSDNIDIIEPKKVYNVKAKEETKKITSKSETVPVIQNEVSKTTTSNEEDSNDTNKETTKTEFTAILEKKASDEDFKEVCEKYNLTEEELFTIIAIVGTEGGGKNYTEGYAIINTIYNRTISKRWVNYVNSLGGNGKSLYGQATAKGQFSVYSNGSYANKMYDKSTKAYASVINFLLDLNIMHNNLSFRPKSSGKEGVQFVSGGNIYFNEITDRI